MAWKYQIEILKEKQYPINLIIKITDDISKIPRKYGSIQNGIIVNLLETQNGLQEWCTSCASLFNSNSLNSKPRFSPAH